MNLAEPKCSSLSIQASTIRWANRRLWQSKYVLPAHGQELSANLRLLKGGGDAECMAGLIPDHH